MWIILHAFQKSVALISLADTPTFVSSDAYLPEKSTVLIPVWSLLCCGESIYGLRMSIYNAIYSFKVVTWLRGLSVVSKQGTHHAEKFSHTLVISPRSRAPITNNKSWTFSSVWAVVTSIGNLYLIVVTLLSNVSVQQELILEHKYSIYFHLYQNWGGYLSNAYAAGSKFGSYQLTDYCWRAQYCSSSKAGKFEKARTNWPTLVFFITPKYLEKHQIQKIKYNLLHGSFVFPQHKSSSAWRMSFI